MEICTCVCFSCIFANAFLDFVFFLYICEYNVGFCVFLNICECNFGFCVFSCIFANAILDFVFFLVYLRMQFWILGFWGFQIVQNRPKSSQIVPNRLKSSQTENQMKLKHNLKTCNQTYKPI